jgi:putative ABC transport system permease protein
MAGIHALVSFAVSQRGREIGIRAALGAHPGRIGDTTFSRALVQLGIGGSLGIAMVLMAQRNDLVSEGPGMVLMVGAVVLLAGLVACVDPASRALRVHPTEAFGAGG